ncbi:MAG: hypothetical protein J6S59_05505 [Clostridia bacterium]|nr:hypothetical protein [Clostridia bacterium]
MANGHSAAGLLFSVQNGIFYYIAQQRAMQGAIRSLPLHPLRAAANGQKSKKIHPVWRKNETIFPPIALLYM